MYNAASRAARLNPSTATRHSVRPHGNPSMLIEQPLEQKYGPPNQQDYFTMILRAPTLNGAISDTSLRVRTDWSILRTTVEAALTKMGLDPLKWHLRDPNDLILDARACETRPMYTEGRYREGDIFTAHTSVRWLWKDPAPVSDGFWYRYEPWQCDQLEYAYNVAKEPSVVLLNPIVSQRKRHTRSVIFEEKSEMTHAMSGEITKSKTVHRGDLWMFMDDRQWQPFGWTDCEKLELTNAHINGSGFLSTNNPGEYHSSKFKQQHWKFELAAEDGRRYVIDFDAMTIIDKSVMIPGHLGGPATPLARCVKRQTDMVKAPLFERRQKHQLKMRNEALGNLCCTELTHAHHMGLTPLR
eukprot:Selendium_serpulae@DN3823_c0_g1_i4.p1